VERRRPKKSVAYLLILTILQWQYADANPTKPKSIILPRIKKENTFLSFIAGTLVERNKSADIPGGL
jgi:hypothetical protein